jgi:hypothetical protein
LPALLAGVAVTILGVEIGPRIRVKGTTLAMDIFVRRAASGAVETALPDELTRPGDQLRVRVTVPTDGFFGVFAVDASPAVHGYLPPGDGLAAVAAGPPHLLDGAIELDGTPGRERLLGVLCPAATGKSRVAAEIGAALAAAGGDAARLEPRGLVRGCAVTSFWLHKVTGR